MLARAGVEPPEFIGVDGTQYPRREHPLEQAADPPAPFQAVEIRTSEAAPCGETVNVVTALEPVSDSVRIRPARCLPTTSGDAESPGR